MNVTCIMLFLLALLNKNANRSYDQNVKCTCVQTQNWPETNSNMLILHFIDNLLKCVGDYFEVCPAIHLLTRWEVCRKESLDL